LLEIENIQLGHLRLSLRLDLDVDAGAEIELHERVERLLRRLEDVEEPLVRADLELLARLLVDVRRAQHRVLVDLGGERDRPRHPRAGLLGRLHDLHRAVVEQLVVVSLELDPDLLSRRHLSPRYLMTSVTTPAPTVRPPSRIAKRSSFSMAMGVMSSTSIVMLSPGITISTPWGSCTDPVTSVVRK